MTISSTPLDLILSVLISLVTGVVSGYCVTKYYRWRDRDRDICLFLEETYDYLLRLEEVLLFGGNDITSKNINELLLFFRKNNRLKIFKWVKLKENEEKVINDIEKFIGKISALTAQYTVNSMCSENNKSWLERLETEIICGGRIELRKYIDEIYDLKKEYIRTICSN